jgi:hypothetical protein
MKYELDISEVKNTGLSQRALSFKLPCKPGDHQLRYDLIECDVPKDIYQELVKASGHPGDPELFPVGFDYIPVGATLKRII